MHTISLEERVDSEEIQKLYMIGNSTDFNLQILKTMVNENPCNSSYDFTVSESTELKISKPAVYRCLKLIKPFLQEIRLLKNDAARRTSHYSIDREYDTEDFEFILCSIEEII